MNSSIITRRHRRFSGLSITLVLFLVTAAPPVCLGPTPAQSASEAAPPGSNASPLPPGRSDLAGFVDPQSEIDDATQASLNAPLLAEPVYGVAPLTVDFHPGLANPQSSLVYQWDFGDGAGPRCPQGPRSRTCISDPVLICAFSRLRPWREGQLLFSQP